MIDFADTVPAIGMEAEARSPHDRLTFLEWLQTSYMLSSKVHGLASQWSLEYGPFWQFPIECLDDTTTREVWIFAPTQAGKSTIMTGWLGYTVECDPVPMGLVMPRDADASERMETHIIPMFELSAELLRHVGGRARNINVGKMTMFDRMAFYLLWASSAAAMSGKAICRIGLDEVGKFPRRVGSEADPISLARDRLETFKGRSKLLGITTPVIRGDLADREYNRGDRCDWWLRCCRCEDYHKPQWKNVELDKGPHKQLLPAEVYSEGGSARYRCPDCSEVYTESDRWSSVMAGQWRTADGALPDRRREFRSFHITGLVLHPAIQTIDYLASRWANAQLAKQSDDLGPLQAFINGRLAETWQIIKAQPDENQLQLHITGHDPGVIPTGGEIVTCAADVQVDHVWFAAFAWGYQFEGWLLDARRIETGSTEYTENFDALLPYFEKGWDLEDNPDAIMVPTVCAIDCGYHTDQVISVCRGWQDIGCLPIMGFGEESMKGKLYRATKLADGLIRYDLNTDRFKDSVYRQLFVAPTPGPGFIHLFKDLRPELLRQLVAERQEPKVVGRRTFLTWQLRDAHWPNHLWDLFTYNRFLAEIAGVPAIARPQTEIVEQREQLGRPIRNRRRPITRNH